MHVDHHALAEDPLEKLTEPGGGSQFTDADDLDAMPADELPDRPDDPEPQRNVDGEETPGSDQLEPAG